MHIFIDESGDLGSGKGASRFFILTALVVPEKKSVDRVVKSLRRSLRKKHRNISEFHAYHIHSSLRVKLLEKIAGVSKLSVAFIAYRKNKILNARQQEALYAQLSEELLSAVCREMSLSGSVNVIFDSRYGESFSKRFVNVNVRRLEDNFKIDFLVSFESSDSNKGLQAVDFVSWSVFRYFEQSEEKYFAQIKDKVVVQKTL